MNFAYLIGKGREIATQRSEQSSQRWDDVLEQNLYHFERMKDFKKRFSAATTNDERFQLVWQLPLVQSMLNDYCDNQWSRKICLKQHSGKDATQASTLRTFGNYSFGKKNYQEAIGLYTYGLSMAPQPVDGDDDDVTKGEEAALLFGNRSAVYLAFKQYENALDDIEFALTLNYARIKPNSLNKLLFRKVECLIRIGRVDEAKTVLQSEILSQTIEPNTTDGMRLKILNNLVDSFVIVEPKPQNKAEEPLKVFTSVKEEFITKGRLTSHPKLSSLNSKLELRYEPSKGRYLVAKEDIDFGEGLAISLPYASVLVDNQELLACHHCCRQFSQPDDPKPGGLNRPIPCGQCSNVMFCGEICRRKSWYQYHRFECGYLPILHQMRYPHLALRIIYKTGLDKIREVIATEELGLTKDPTDLFDPEDYLHIYRFEHHADKFAYSDLIVVTLGACLAAKMAKMSGFLKEEECVRFLGGLLLRHCCQVFVNHKTINEKSDQKLKGKGRGETPELGFAIYGASSLFNHSCFPNAHNATRYRPDISLMSLQLIQARRPIKAGQEVTIFYDDHKNAYFNRAVRQEALKDLYFFHCTCAVCARDERDNPDGNEDYYAIACDTCQALVTSSSGVYSCENGHKISILEARRKCMKIRKLIADGMRLREKIEDHIEGASGKIPRKLLDRFVKLVEDELSSDYLVHIPSFYELPGFFDRLCYYRNHNGEFRESLVDLEKCAYLLEVIYGEESFEVYQRLLRLKVAYPVTTVQMEQAYKGDSCVDVKQDKKWLNVMAEMYVRHQNIEQRLEPLKAKMLIP